MSTQPYFEAVARQMPQARYVLPDFEERTAYGFRRQNPYTKLFEDRIVFLGVQVDDASADDVMAQLLVLESQDPDSLITMYINSPRWFLHGADGDLRHDAVHQAAGADGVPRSGRLCSRRAAGRWFARKASGAAQRSYPHSPAGDGGHAGAGLGQSQIVADEIDRMRAWLEDAISYHSGKSVEQVRRDIERDKILTAPQAAEYGLIDQVLESRKVL